MLGYVEDGLERNEVRVWAEHRRSEGTEELGLYPAGNREPVKT